MMKRLFTTLLLLSLTSVVSLHAQVQGLGFGPRAGINFADYLNSSGSSRIGVHAGMFVDYNFTRRWGIETGVYYSQFGSTNNVEMGSGGEYTIHRMDYLVVPLVGKFNFLGGFRAMVGLEGMFKLTADRIYKEGSRPAAKMTDIRSSNLGFMVGAGYLFRCGLDLSASYSKSFHSAILHTGETTCPFTFRVAAGWRFIGTRK